MWGDHSPKPGIRSPKPVDGSPNPKVQSPISGTLSPMAGVGDTDPGGDFPPADESNSNPNPGGRSMADTYIPDPDAAFDTWQTQYATYLNANLVALGLTALDRDVVALSAQRTDWQTKYPALVAAQDAAQAARWQKMCRGRPTKSSPAA